MDIKIIDSIMGSGKTSWAIQEMSNEDEYALSELIQWILIILGIIGIISTII